MRIRRVPFALGSAVLALLFAVAIGAAWGGRLKPVLVLWVLTSVAVVAAWLFLDRARQLHRLGTGKPPRVSAVYDELKLTTLGAACLLLAVLLFVATIDWRVSVVLLALSLAWVLMWTPRANRTLVMRVTIEVRCTPQAAFELVSNPNNWPLYVPEIELSQPVEVPVHVGIVIHDRVRRDGKIVFEGEEEVLVLEPGKRFGTSIRNGPQSSSGIYEFEPVAGGTKIDFTHRSLMSLSTAIFGGGLRRSGLATRLAAGRGQIMMRIKRLLEEPQATSV